MIHVVFQEADIAALQASFDLDETLRGEILQVKDDFAVGPLNEIYGDTGREKRKAWWHAVLQGGDYEDIVSADNKDDYQQIQELINQLQQDENEELWIWVAPNKHDVSGYYWLVSQLQNFVGRIYVLMLGNLPFINDKGHIFYPDNLFEIPAREFVKAKRLARCLTPADFEMDAEEWQKLIAENKMVRILEGSKKLLQYGDDFYDKELLKFITPDWQRASKVITQFLNKARHTTGDAYLLWRIKRIVTDNVIDVQGDTKHMKDFEIKLKASE